MANGYKCPICGCTEYYSIPGAGEEESLRSLVKYSFDINGDAYIRKADVSFDASVRLCKNCGHMDLFNERMLKEIKKDEQELSKLVSSKKEGLHSLEARGKNIKKELEKISKEINEIPKKLKDESITVKEHNDLKAALLEHEKNKKLLEKEFSDLDYKVQKAKEELSAAQYKLTNVERLRRV